MTATKTIARPRPGGKPLARPHAPQGDYLKLVRRFALRPIRKRSEYDAALAVLDPMMGRDNLSAGEADYVDALTTFVELYDAAHYPADDEPMEPVAFLRALLDNAEMSTTDLGAILGSKGVASEVLNGKRALSKTHIAKLASHFKVERGLFLSSADVTTPRG